MIYTGVDIVQISAFALQLKDSASVFEKQTFTKKERQYAYQIGLGSPEDHLAARFAAKEALIKAWSSSFFGQPPQLYNPSLQEIEVQKDRFGRPKITLHGTLRERIHNFNIQVSLSHDGDYAIATVILQEQK